MFAVKLESKVRINGCPERGLEALDWRRAHGLADRHDDVVHVAGEWDDESLFRALAEAGYTPERYTDGSAKIVLSGIGASGWPPAGDTRHGSAYGWYAAVPVDVVRSFVASPDPDSALDLLLAIAAASRARDEERKRADAERAAEDAASRERFARQDADRTAAKLAAEEAEAVERNSWIAEHGSPRLRRLAAESIECGAVYRDERLAAERPGWEWEDAIPDGLAEREAPRNAPEAALDLLDRARETAPDATLGFVADADHGRGYVASATFLGRAIVLGRDQLVVEPESDEEE